MVSRSIPFEYFLLSGIRADAYGRRYYFVGVAQRDRAGRIDVLSLKEGEWIVSPNLIYEAA
ncbi:hypothetical protein ACQZ6F_25270 [Rhizobium sp. A22-96]